MTSTRTLVMGAALAAMACSPALAEAPRAGARAPAPVAPLSASGAGGYSIELIGSAGETLPTYSHGGRYYVLGNRGERYSIRVVNPTARRIEAVVSVDGLDVIDGRPADYREKRGYIVPAYGDVIIDGFRVSTSAVAAFRFSSVKNSYAGRKGKPRHVGVVGVAIFEERVRRPNPVLIDPVRPHPRPHHRGTGRGYGGAPAPADDFDSETEGAPAPAPRVSAGEAAPAGRRGGAAPSRAPAADAPCCDRGARRSERPGLGTEFGEHRSSHVSWTRFVRRNDRRPDAMAVLRYNNRAGLLALGVTLEPEPDYDDLYLRESADPFPGRLGFSRPPR